MKLAVTLLVFCIAALMALGMVTLYSSGMQQMGARYLVLQMVWASAGIVCCAVAALLDYRWLKKAAWIFFGISLAMLALVLVPGIGTKINGARRWFFLGRINLQPSEIAKLALIMMIAWYGDRFQRQMGTWKRGVVIPGAIIAATLGLIFVEPDRGTTILLACVSGCLLITAGARLKYLLPPVVLALVGLAVSLIHDPMRTKRIFGWLHLEEHKDGVSYQAYQAVLAFGSGGWTGLGLGNGRQKMFVPENHTDFILSIIGEELGLAGTLSVLTAFLVILICGIYISTRSKDAFGFLLGSGITFLIGLQAMINIGVVTSALPNKGLPLPFVSYGGSNLLIMLTAVGLLLSIARQARATETMPTRKGDCEDHGAQPTPQPAG
jgi:cell division protein FtsW